MPRKNSTPKPSDSKPASAFEQAWEGLRRPGAPPPTVSGRWLLTAGSLAVLVAAVCAWGALCLLFWQGSWQLLYHPASTISRTPASAGLAFEPIGFAATEAGEPRLQGWWIPAAPDAKYARYTVLYLHGQDGNLGDTVDSLAQLHSIGVNIFAFDYRGYGQSQFVRPCEAHWRVDTAWAYQYLVGTRHIAANTILLEGRALGANLALEVAAAHPEIGGVVLDQPLDSPMSAVFDDARARLVPAHWLVQDRYDSELPAAGLRIPSLWLIAVPVAGKREQAWHEAYNQVKASKMTAWIADSTGSEKDSSAAFMRWLDDLELKTN